MIFGLFGLGVALTILVGSILGIVAFSRSTSTSRMVRDLREEMRALRARLMQSKAVDMEPPSTEPTPRPETPRPEPAPEPIHEKPQPPPAPKEEIPVARPAPPAWVSAPSAASAAEKWARFEETAGKMWMAWAGALVLFLSAGFFVKYAIDHGWLGPTARVVLGIIMGIVMLSCGDCCLRRKKRALGEALLGGGLAVLYVSLFAAFSLYDLIPQWAAFTAMVLVAAAGMVLAVLHNAMATSFLAVLGGFITPLLVSTGEDARDTLFAYLLILNLGVLGVALFKRWRALDVLAFICTAILFTGWFAEFYDKPAMVPTLLWLACFYLVFLLIPFGYHLRKRTPIELERFMMAMINSLLAFTCAYIILQADYRHTLGFVSLGMAACHVALGSQTRRAVPSDVRGLFGFVALAVSFLTIAAPLHLKLQGITLVWAVEAPVLLYLGYRYKYLPVRVAGFIVLVLTAFRIFSVHWPLHHALFTPILNTNFGTVICIPLAAGVFAAIHHMFKGAGDERDRTLKLAAAIGGGLLAVMLLRVEMTAWLEYSKLPYLASCVGVLVRALGAAVFLAASIRARSSATCIAGLLPLAIAVIGTMCLYGEKIPGDYILLLNVRFLVGLLTAVVAFIYGFATRRHSGISTQAQALSKVLLTAGGLLLLILLSLETHYYCYEVILDTKKAAWIARMALSLTWGVCATAALVIGFWRQIRPLRFAALALFGITALKLVIVDISGVRQIYHIISFFTLGVLMIGAAYLYSRVEKQLEAALGGRKQ